jgi:hypothetical protein
MTGDGKGPDGGTGGGVSASRIAPGVPTHQAGAIQGAVLAGLREAAASGIAIHVGQLSVRLSPGASAAEIEQAVRRAIESNWRGRRP